MRSSQNPESNDFITDQDLEELEVSRDLWEDWYLIMNYLWVGSQQEYPDSIMGENEIHIGPFRISANFVNNSYVEIALERGEDLYLLVRYENNPEAVVGCVFALLKSLSHD